MATRLDPALRAWARRLRNEGASVRQVAEQTGLSVTTAWRTLRGDAAEGPQPAERHADEINTAGQATTPAAPDAPASRTGVLPPGVIPPELAGPYPLNGDRPEDHPAVRGLAGWRRRW